jgi:hypothetical protein
VASATKIALFLEALGRIATKTYENKTTKSIDTAMKVRKTAARMQKRPEKIYRE